MINIRGDLFTKIHARQQKHFHQRAQNDDAEIYFGSKRGDYDVDVNIIDERMGN
jgi:hypothetical protein